METIKMELDEAFKMLSEISVSRDGVELMAAAKEHLRRAYKMCDEDEKVISDG